MIKNIIKYKLLLLAIAIFCSCKKSSYLDVKPDEALVVPSTLKDFQALMDNDIIMNGAGTQGVLPGLGEVGSDDYYLLDDDYNAAMPPLYRNCYVWAKQLYSGEEIYDWDYPYRAVFYANIVLDGIEKLKSSNSDQININNLTGAALFHRANMFFALAQIFALPYDKQSAVTNLGIPLRMHSDINESVQRATLQQTYDQIFRDLIQAIPLLPDKPLYKSRPSKPAAYGLLSRVFLSMKDYDNALLYADSCLQKVNGLMDYNKIVTGSGYAIPLFNDEVIFSCTLLPLIPINYSYADSTLYNSYDSNDLRKTIFFQSYNGLSYFTGSYDGSYDPFGGIAVDEMLLNRSECFARKGNTSAALKDLNTLLITRWQSATYIPVTATGPQDGLQKILKERRKELVFRGLRWIDLRRLNKDSAFAIQLKRIINGQTYLLPPNDTRYVYPIPDNVIKVNPGMAQNQR